MKFIARKGAPDIPLELIEAQENDQLVFFCGAGVSYPSGLPGFEGLVESVYLNLPEIKDEIEEQAIKAGFYDRALGLLEARVEQGNTTGINLVRKEIIARLHLDPSANVDTHKALLQLSKTATGNYRLITTNVDHGFLIADETVKKQFDSAPTLPVPKPHKWSTVVHLHGLIDTDRDPNGDHLVFTSGDFGSAYLTERWASKFVTELFLNFTVVFVGYSINDPVIRYMTDAIAAERRQGSELFNRPYVIADTTNKNWERSLKEWLAKGVEPVLYVKGGKNHPNLHNSLRAWAAHTRDGLSSKQRIVKSKARLVPLPPYDQDESIKQVLDTLKERVDQNHKNVSGYPAKIFADLDDPPAPIDWLPVLHKEGLLSISKISRQTNVTSSDPINSNLLCPNKISANLWGWLLHHLESDVLVRWVIEQGVCLHPWFKNSVSRQLITKPPSEPYLSFWKIITSEKICVYRSSPTEGSDVVHELIAGADELTLSAFRQLLEPTYEITKSYSWEGDEGREDHKPKKPFSMEVVIGLEDWVFSALTDSEHYPDRYTNLLGSVTQSLYKAMELRAFVGQANHKDDRSHWDIASIEPHSQNHRTNSLSCLVELNRDLWCALYQKNRSEARPILMIWQSYQFPIFRRLTFHAFTTTDVVAADDAMDYLLEDDGWWLWSVSTTRETYRLLNKFWSQLSQNKAELLLSLVVTGPPRTMYRIDLSHQEFQERFDRERWLVLAKLESFGRSLFGEAQTLYDELTRQYPQWKLREGDRDEFTYWFSSGVGNDTDITSESLFSLTLPERVTLLTEENLRYGDGRTDVFRFAGKEHSMAVIETLKYMFDQEKWHRDSWGAGLTGIAELDVCTWDSVAPMVEKLPDEIYKQEAWAIAWWARKAVQNVEVGSIGESQFWEIASRMLAVNSTTELELDDDSDAFERAINNPVGIITEAILDRLNLHSVNVQDGLPRPQPFNLIDQIVDGDFLMIGRVILFSRLTYFYAVEPKWVQEKLIPLLDFNFSNDAKHYWQGYLSNPRISADIAIDLKESILQAMEVKVLTGRDLEGLVNLFTLSCLQYSDLYSNKEIQQAFRVMGVDGLAHAADFMWRAVSYTEEGRDTYWEHRIKPLLRNAWPKGGGYLTQNIARGFTLMLLQLNTSFPEALAAVMPMLCPINEERDIFHRFGKSNVIDKYPEESFQLLIKIFSEDSSWNNDHLSTIMARLIAVNPNFQERTEFIAINDYLAISDR